MDVCKRAGIFGVEYRNKDCEIKEFFSPRVAKQLFFKVLLNQTLKILLFRNPKLSQYLYITLTYRSKLCNQFYLICCYFFNFFSPFPKRCLLTPDEVRVSFWVIHCEHWTYRHNSVVYQSDNLQLV